ncbi:hypothetical protein HmCmsJML079_03438 [Escherichia coli]|nr:hypothetical protein HmCmsJML079_03438 [Escherichia coli]
MCINVISDIPFRLSASFNPVIPIVTEVIPVITEVNPRTTITCDFEFITLYRGRI